MLGTGYPTETAMQLSMAKAASRDEQKLRVRQKEAAANKAIDRANERLQLQGAPMTIDPLKFGLTNVSTTKFTHELQVHMQNYTQIMQSLSPRIRMLQDQITKTIRNIRE